MPDKQTKVAPIMLDSELSSQAEIAEFAQQAYRQNILAVLEQANRIASMTSLEDLLNQMLELMIEVSGANAGTLYLLDRDAGELVFKVIKGEKGAKGLVGMRIKQNQGIVGAAIQQLTPIVIENLSRDPRWYRDISPEETAQLHNAITMPLLLQGTPIGAVQIFNYENAELELLQLLGNRMASEVDKVLLLEKAKRSNQRLQALVNILGQVSATLDHDHLLQLLTTGASSLLEAEHSSVMLAAPGGEEITIVSDKPTEPETTLSGEKIPSKIQMHTFLAHSAVAVPLRARSISVGKQRRALEERVIGNLMVLNKQHGAFDAEDTQLLEILASQASTLLQISLLYNDANGMFLDFIKTLAATIDAKDPYTRGHSQRVSDFSVQVAEEMGLSNEDINDIRVGSLLHDIGKIGVPDYIITKPDRLSDEEYVQMKKHPSIGYRIMMQVRLLQNVLPSIAEHHERLDGTGYPFGLHGEQISQVGRIVAVADVFDAMTTDRPYRKALEVEMVFDHLLENIGTHFDGHCVQALISSELKKKTGLTGNPGS